VLRKPTLNFVGSSPILVSCYCFEEGPLIEALFSLLFLPLNLIINYYCLKKSPQEKLVILWQMGIKIQKRLVIKPVDKGQINRVKR